jgi:hypothetical protein
MAKRLCDSNDASNNKKQRTNDSSSQLNYLNYDETMYWSEIGSVHVTQQPFTIDCSSIIINGSIYKVYSKKHTKKTQEEIKYDIESITHRIAFKSLIIVIIGKDITFPITVTNCYNTDNIMSGLISICKQMKGDLKVRYEITYSVTV